MKPYYETPNGKLYHGDCLEIMPQLEPVDMIITDPPYSTPTVSSFGRKIHKHLSDLAIQEYYFVAVRDAMEVASKPSAPFFIFCDDTYSAVLTAIFYHYQQTGLLVWDKKRIGMGSPFRRRHELVFYAFRESVDLNGEVSHIPTILEYPIKKTYHGAEKPTGLISILLRGLTAEQSTILDPFFGSGSTAISCERLNRRWIGIEIEEKYCEISAKRIENERKQLKLF